MSAYKTAQEIVVYRNRRFHFVSYEGHRADLARQRDEVPSTWFLMLANKRWPVMQQVPNQTRDELLQQLTDWLERSIFAGGGPAIAGATPTPAAPETTVIRKTGRRPAR